MGTAVHDQRLALVRLLHRDLDLAGYFEAADRALQRCLAFDASCWLSLDPGGVMPTSHFSREYSVAHLMQVAANEFLEDDVNKFADLARAPRPVGILSQLTDGEQSRSPRYVRFLAPLGFADGDELRAVFKDGGAVWGAVALHRRLGTFTDADAKAVADVGGLLAQGIRRAILRSALSAIGDDDQPGLIVLRSDDSIDSMTAAASGWLGELIDSTATSGTTPLTIVSVAQVARRVAAGLSSEAATVRLPRRTGGWMRLDASLLERGNRVRSRSSSAPLASPRLRD
jgi:hypothetical protein